MDMVRGIKVHAAGETEADPKGHEEKKGKK